MASAYVSSASSLSRCLRTSLFAPVYNVQRSCRHNESGRHRARCAPSVARRARQSPFACNVSDEEADWIVADVAVEDIDPELVNHVQQNVDEAKADAKRLVRVALKDASAELSVLLCSDKFIRSVNSEWRGKDVATDVLSFPQNDQDGVILGDIVISLETAACQAAERDCSLRDEVRVLLLHGLLHLLGYDHEGAVHGDALVVSWQFFPLVSCLCP